MSLDSQNGPGLDTLEGTTPYSFIFTKPRSFSDEKPRVEDLGSAIRHVFRCIFLHLYKYPQPNLQVSAIYPN